MIINRIYENQNLLSMLLLSFLVGLRTYQLLCILCSAYTVAQLVEALPYRPDSSGFDSR